MVEQLKEIICKYPDALSNRQILRALFMDHFPSDRRRKLYHTSKNNDALTIYCYAGSKGQEYARKEGFNLENAAKA